MGTGAGGLVTLWWVFYILLMLLRNVRMMMANGMLSGVPIDALNLVLSFGWLIPLAAYGLLYYIVKSVSAKL
jgi:hypothetical protein